MRTLSSWKHEVSDLRRMLSKACDDLNRWISLGLANATADDLKGQRQRIDKWRKACQRIAHKAAHYKLMGTGKGENNG